MKNIAVLCAATIVSAGFLAVPAEARDRYERRCGHAVELNTGIGAVAGGILGAQINRGRGDARAAFGGAIVGAIVGNAIARNDCDDAYHYDRAHYNTVRYGRAQSWRNPNTGYYGDFRINRTYQDNGYWERDRWHSSNDTYRDDRRDRRAGYRRTMCREYTETYYRPGRYFETHVVCRAGDGSWRVVG